VLPSRSSARQEHFPKNTEAEKLTTDPQAGGCRSIRPPVLYVHGIGAFNLARVARTMQLNPPAYYARRRPPVREAADHQCTP